MIYFQEISPVCPSNLANLGGTITMINYSIIKNRIVWAAAFAVYVLWIASVIYLLFW